VLPVVAAPLRRPRNTLRYLDRFGCNIAYPLLLFVYGRSSLSPFGRPYANGFNESSMVVVYTHHGSS